MEWTVTFVMRPSTLVALVFQQSQDMDLGLVLTAQTSNLPLYSIAFSTAIPLPLRFVSFCVSLPLRMDTYLDPVLTHQDRLLPKAADFHCVVFCFCYVATISMDLRLQWTWVSLPGEGGHGESQNVRKETTRTRV